MPTRIVHLRRPGFAAETVQDGLRVGDCRFRLLFHRFDQDPSHSRTFGPRHEPIGSGHRREARLHGNAQVGQSGTHPLRCGLVKVHGGQIRQAARVPLRDRCDLAFVIAGYPHAGRKANGHAGHRATQSLHGPSDIAGRTLPTMAVPRVDMDQIGAGRHAPPGGHRTWGTPP